MKNHVTQKSPTASLLLAGSLATALALSAASSATAATTYFHKGKIIAKFTAMQKLDKNPGTKILKVQSSYVKLNRQTGNLIKLTDAPLSAIPK